jgi:hypothetical protein
MQAVFRSLEKSFYNKVVIGIYLPKNERLPRVNYNIVVLPDAIC